MSELVMGSVISVLSLLLGAWYGRKTAFDAISWQMRKTAGLARQAHLINLRQEFEHNQSILFRLQTYIGPAPNIEHRWAPAEVTASYLKVNAWDELIKAGVLPDISESDQVELEIANRTVLDVRRTVQEKAANWLRIREWEKYDLEHDSTQPASARWFGDFSVEEINQAIDYSLKELQAAIALLGGLKQE